MAEHVTLLGADDVRSAGYTMQSAAEEMKRAAATIDYALERHHRFMDDWLSRFEQILNTARNP